MLYWIDGIRKNDNVEVRWHLTTSEEGDKPYRYIVQEVGKENYYFVPEEGFAEDYESSR